MTNVRKHTRTLRNGRKVTVHSHDRDQVAGSAAPAAPAPLPAGTPEVGGWSRGGISSNLADPWLGADPVWADYPDGAQWD